MMQPELFDIIELLVDLPEFNLHAGVQGSIVEHFNENAYEVEFANSDGETLAFCTLSPQQFIVVWKSSTKTWLSVGDKLASIVNYLPGDRQKEILNFARFIYYQN